MKHSHSCQSMPVGPKLSDSCSQESPQLHSDTSKAIETGIVLSIEKTFTCFEKWSLIKQQLLFTESIKNILDVPKSETFVYFTKIMAAIWSINKIISVSIALDTPFESSEKFLSKSSPSNSASSEEQKSLSVSSEKLVKTQSQGPKVVVTNDQEVLSKQLEFARQRSR